MKRIYVNEKWCLGCHLCEYYCAFAHTGLPDMATALKDKHITPRLCIEEGKDVCYAVSCRHCAEPLCAQSCIAGALTAENGVIRVDTDKCVGCYTCVLSCPYGAIMPSEKGVVRKCDLCAESSGGQPACVQHCPNNAIVYEERGSAQ